MIHVGLAGSGIAMLFGVIVGAWGHPEVSTIGFMVALAGLFTAAAQLFGQMFIFGKLLGRIMDSTAREAETQRQMAVFVDQNTKARHRLADQLQVAYAKIDELEFELRDSKRQIAEHGEKIKTVETLATIKAEKAEPVKLDVTIHQDPPQEPCP